VLYGTDVHTRTILRSPKTFLPERISSKDPVNSAQGPGLLILIRIVIHGKPETEPLQREQHLMPLLQPEQLYSITCKE